MLRKDYAKYFETKMEWRKQLKNMHKNIIIGLFCLTSIMCVAQIFIK